MKNWKSKNYFFGCVPRIHVNTGSQITFESKSKHWMRSYMPLYGIPGTGHVLEKNKHAPLYSMYVTYSFLCFVFYAIPETLSPFYLSTFPFLWHSRKSLKLIARYFPHCYSSFRFAPTKYFMSKSLSSMCMCACLCACMCVCVIELLINSCLCKFSYANLHTWLLM